jgi:tetratricopeptide (TPR) repeat protein
LSEKNESEAIKSYIAAIQCFPSPIYYSNLSAVYTATQQYTEAIDSANKALELDPGYSKAYGRLGAIYFNQKNFEKSFENYEKALSFDPQNKTYVTGSQKASEFLKKKQPQQQMQMPDLSSILGGATGGQGMPSMDQIGGLMNNPEFMNMAMGMMQQPGFKDIMGNMMKSMNVSPDISPDVIEEIKKMEEYAESENVQAFVASLESEGMNAIYKYMGDAEVQKFIMKISQRKFEDGTSPFQGLNK